MSQRYIAFWFSVLVAALYIYWTHFLAEDSSIVMPSVGVVQDWPESLPDFSSYRDVKEKKAAFFSYLKPMVEDENQRVLAQRDQLKMLQQKTTFDVIETNWLTAMANYYRVDMQDDDQATITALLAQVDIVPVSLALTQAANESAWGTSRFAKKGNNLFGQWCFQKGCGIVPTGRPAGQSYEVARFDSPRHSVSAYVRNLNSNRAYLGLRQRRQQLRESNQFISGAELAAGLEKYSARGAEYVNELRAMIRVNQLAQYDAR